MSEPIVMGSMQVALLPKSSMSATADIRLCAAHIMPAWIAWILPNAIVAVGILWLLQNDCKNGGKYIAVMSKAVDGVSAVHPIKNCCGARDF